MSTVNKFQYKQCLCILTCPTMKCIIYRPDLYNWPTRGKELKIVNNYNWTFYQCQKQKYPQIWLFLKFSKITKILIKQQKNGWKKAKS